MKIAFTSCCDTVNDPLQAGWQALHAHAPDLIVLLGDTVYMDYGLGDHLKNGKPYKLSLAEFSTRLHSAYQQQWQVASFRTAIHGRRVHAIWDDHDFAWNNARGGQPADGDRDYVRPEVRRLSRALLEQFRQALDQQPASYPPNPYPDGVVTADGGSIAQRIPLSDQLCLHLLDGRSFREKEGGSLLGSEQRNALQAALLPEPAVNLIASATTLKDWSHYSEYAWLKQQAQSHRILMLSGDIHEPDFRSRGRLFEATASAMAQPPRITRWVGKKSEVFGVLETSPDQLNIALWHKGKAERQTIDLADWSSDD